MLSEVERYATWFERLPFNRIEEYLSLIYIFWFSEITGYLAVWLKGGIGIYRGMLLKKVEFFHQFP